MDKGREGGKCVVYGVLGSCSRMLGGGANGDLELGFSAVHE